MKWKHSQKNSALLAPWPRHHYLSKTGGGGEGWGGSHTRTGLGRPPGGGASSCKIQNALINACHMADPAALFVADSQSQTHWRCSRSLDIGVLVMGWANEHFSSCRCLPFPKTSIPQSMTHRVPRNVVASANNVAAMALAVQAWPCVHSLFQLSPPPPPPV